MIKKKAFNMLKFQKIVKFAKVPAKQELTY